MTEETKRKISLAKMGAPAWNKGITLSEEGRQKLRGKRPNFIPWNKGKKVLALLGNTFGFVRGHSPWNKGIPWSEEIKKKVSKTKMGTEPWNKGKPYLQIRGEKHPNWRGGINPIHDTIRKSLEYKNWQQFCMERDGYRCYDCGERGGKLNVHHIYSFSNYPRLRFMLENGITLCEECHKKISTRGIRKTFMSTSASSSEFTLTCHYTTP